jgi:hypothetical protein
MHIAFMCMISYTRGVTSALLQDRAGIPDCVHVSVSTHARSIQTHTHKRTHSHTHTHTHTHNCPRLFSVPDKTASHIDFHVSINVCCIQNKARIHTNKYLPTPLSHTHTNADLIRQQNHIDFHISVSPFPFSESIFDSSYRQPLLSVSMYVCFIICTCWYVCVCVYEPIFDSSYRQPLLPART